LHDKTGITTVFVTHDQEEALALGDLVAVMNKGKIEQIGTPKDVRFTPASPFVAEFLSDTVMDHLPATPTDPGVVSVH
jgi:ABC-type Fe3+/spermidine/putrescine transport system ATPase subunit